jgi:DNA mismatch repair protein MutH
LQRAGRLPGRTLAQIATERGVPVPGDQKRAKGWIGKLMELSLGATAATLPEPDFEHIGVELKTLPLNNNGRPRESTYICTVTLTAVSGGLEWRTSTVKKKLDRVLWVPVEADPGIPIPLRRIGNPFIWSPDRIQQQALRTDWEEFMERIVLGELDRIDARHGKVLQIRPKAANAGTRTRTPDATGETGVTVPRGFYLRTSFTGEILKRSTFNV